MSEARLEFFVGLAIGFTACFLAAFSTMLSLKAQADYWKTRYCEATELELELCDEMLTGR